MINNKRKSVSSRLDTSINIIYQTSGEFFYLHRQSISCDFFHVYHQMGTIKCTVSYYICMHERNMYVNGMRNCQACEYKVICRITYASIIEL